MSHSLTTCGGIKKKVQYIFGHELDLNLRYKMQPALLCLVSFWRIELILAVFLVNTVL